ncbi:hypothetical protein J7643_17105 [bacterium]|nr:hypothetical protein [bacterium]
MKRPLLASIAALALLAGCQSSPFGLSPARSVSLHVRPQIQSGGLSTQALVTKYTAADVVHLVVQVFKTDASGADGVVMGSLDVPATDFKGTLTFDNLAPNTTYRLKAYAYSEEGNDAAHLISKPDSVLEVQVQDNDTPAVEDLVVRLVDRTYSGAATISTIVVTPGGYDASDSITFTPFR